MTICLDLFTSPFLTPVAQLVDAAVLNTVCCGFDSRQEYRVFGEQFRDPFFKFSIFYAPVAQWEEALVSSTRGCEFKSHREYQVSECGAAWSARLVWGQDVAGSNPATRTVHTPVAQPEEALVLDTRGCGFDSHQEYFAPVAKSVNASV